MSLNSQSNTGTQSGTLHSLKINIQLAWKIHASCDVGKSIDTMHQNLVALYVRV